MTTDLHALEILELAAHLAGHAPVRRPKLGGRHSEGGALRCPLATDETYETPSAALEA